MKNQGIHMHEFYDLEHQTSRFSQFTSMMKPLDKTQSGGMWCSLVTTRAPFY